MEKHNIVRYVWYVVFALSPLALFSQNPIELLASLLTLPILFSLLWRTGEPQVLLFGFLFQWLTISLKLYYGIYIDKPLNQVIPGDMSPNHIVLSFYLSLIGLLVFVLGTRLVIRRINSQKFSEVLLSDIAKYDARRITIFYIVFYAFTEILLRYRFVFPFLNTPITAISYLRWGFFLFTFYLVHKQNNFRTVFYIIVFLQFVSGFGFFSGFKETIFYSIIGLIFIRPRISRSQVAILIITAIFIFRLGIIWTAVKGEYREYLTGGKRGMQQTVSTIESLPKFYKLATSVKKKDNDQALTDFIDRISYIDYFSLTLTHVPAVVPHTAGNILKGSLMNIFVPRIINPDKKAIDDSKHTSYYTGRHFTGGGIASFSLGYTADAYIDFGMYFMFVPIFLIGLLLGFFYKYLLINSFNAVWGIIFIGPFYSFANVYGMNTIKVLGVMVSYFIIAILIRRPLELFSNKYLLKTS